ncbi:uncharacterized protein LOC119595731 [Penaeus monodon]|uniref:uncharacterized protein LOC119595731 n=1 Tax=Penaeus monodon TaxID=6687 RepID=UPI0018A740C4|nr:uncharacterized protein LOC119595731 [Penaeus monodon]
MPPYKPVHSLKAFAKDKVMYNVCAVILDEIFFTEEENWDIFGPPRLSTRLSIVRDILASSLTPTLLEDLLNTILSKDEAVEATVRYLALQLLLVEGVRNLMIGNFPESYYEWVLEATGLNGAGIQTLDLRGVWIREEHRYFLIKALRKLQDVRKLTLRYNCDDEMLATLGKYCLKLQKLDISGSARITVDGLKQLCENPSRTHDTHLTQTLQIVDLGGPGSQNLSVDLACYLLRTLPHLVSLGSYEHTGAALEILHKNCPEKQFGLKYLHDVITTSGRHFAICKACPDIQAIYLDSPKDIAIHFLDMLNNLSEVKMHKVRWSDVLVMLKKMGSRIRSLFLLTVFGQVDMIELGSLCPNMIRLEIHNVSLSCSDTTHRSAFHSIKELFIYNSQISTTCVKLIMNQCLNVEHLTLGDCAQLTDPAIILSMRDHSLRHVKEIWFGVAQNLTMRTIEALIEHCPLLTSLGNLAAWSVHPDDINLLRVQCMVTNVDLALHEYGPDEEEQWIPIEAI